MKLIKYLYLVSLISSGNLFCVEIILNGNTKVITLDSSQRSLEVFLFTINNRELDHINVNQPDNFFSSTFKPGEDITFSINMYGIQHNFTPPPAYQNRFRLCVAVGLCSFIKIKQLSAPDLITDIRSYHQSILPTCSEFACFLDTGGIEFPHRRRILLNKSTEGTSIEPFTTLDFYGAATKKFMHQMIYLGYGIGFSKLGTGFVYFHTVHAIQIFYETDAQESLYIKQSKPSDQDDSQPPPPSAGAEITTP